MIHHQEAFRMVHSITQRKRSTVSRIAAAVIVCISMISQVAVLHAQVNHGYPRNGIFHWGPATPEWYAKYDLLITCPWSADFAREIKALNPDILLIATRDWNNGAGISNVPAEWYTLDSNGNPITIYYHSVILLDMTDFCPPSARHGNKRYNEYLPEFFANMVDLTVWDGVASDGVYFSPRGTALQDVDLDRNGVNDYGEHGSDWVRNQWSAGVSKVIGRIRQIIGNDKIIHLNSAQFHTQEWHQTNGLTSENRRLGGAMSDFKWKYEHWMNTAPYPHTYLMDGEGDSKNDFYWMRYHLGCTLIGDGYCSFSEAKYGGNWHYNDKYYDEFDVELGNPTSLMQNIFVTGGSQNGAYVRFFENGAAILNHGDVPVEVTDSQLRAFAEYDGPYYRFEGGQDPAHNTGELFDSAELFGRPDYIGHVGDCILLLEQPTTVITEIIIDNCDAGTSPASEPAELIGEWTPHVEAFNESWTVFEGGSSSKNIWEFADALYGNGETYAVFRPTIGVAANYEVFEWHGWSGVHPDNFQEGTNVPYRITYTGGATSEGTLNQSINYGQWNSLGTYFFDTGTNGNVTISNDADGIVIADAIKFVYRGKEVDSILPNSPRNLGFESTEKTIRLTWDAPLPAEDGDTASSYQIFRDHAFLATPSSTSYLDTDVEENTSYLYQVYSLDNYGNRSSGWAEGTFATIEDQIPPSVSSVVALGLKSVDVVFDEDVEESSAENVHNYTIQPSVAVLQAELAQDLRTVRLTTNTHVIGLEYTLSVNHIYDRAASPNMMTTPDSETYTGKGGVITVTISADDAYELYVNGNLVGNNNSWSISHSYTVQSIAGKNVIAVKCTDGGGDGGMLAEVDFGGERFVTDHSWKVSTVEEDQWETVDFSDISWNKATSYGLHGVAEPWSLYKNVTGISTSDVHWIWSADKFNDNLVFLRLNLYPGGDTTPPEPPIGVSVSER